jgi:hypothetical protein
MSATRPRKSNLVFLSLLLALIATCLAPQAKLSTGGHAIALKAPSFVSVAHAQESAPATVSAFPQDEAGISAYFKSANTINLASAASAFRVIEAQTADYIIGSVPVANYDATQDVHVYVSHDGWFVAYYLAPDPASKIINWRTYTAAKITTKLEETLSIVAVAAAVPFTQATFYDFRNPNATNLMLVMKSNEQNNPDSFQIKLPLTYAYYERSWQVVNAGGYTAHYNLDGVEIAHSVAGTGAVVGTLSAGQLLPDTFHTVAISVDYDHRGYAGLALVYKVQ